MGDQAGRVLRAYPVGDAAAQARTVRGSGLDDLVADRVHDHAGMVEVLRHERVHVAFPPLRESARVVVTGLRDRPHVEQLVHDEHAESVARVEQGDAHRVVRGAYGVEAGCLERPHPPFGGVGEVGGAEDAVVVVDRTAAELDGLAVDPQAADRVGGDGADTEVCGCLVDRAAVVVEAHGRLVEVGRVDAPQ
nr:hypothetical protein [Streptomyces resistomycificus]